MICYLYQNKSEKIKVDKSLTLITSTDIVVKESTSITSPVFTLSLTNDKATKFNYIYVPELNRYYYVTDIVMVRNNLFEITCHCDVLMSFKKDIRNQSGIIGRQENLYNLYLSDPYFTVNQKQSVVTKEFKKGFLDDASYVLLVASGKTE